MITAGYLSRMTTYLALAHAGRSPDPHLLIPPKLPFGLLHVAEPGEDDHGEFIGLRVLDKHKSLKQPVLRKPRLLDPPVFAALMLAQFDTPSLRIAHNSPERFWLSIFDDLLVTRLARDAKKGEQVAFVIGHYDVRLHNLKIEPAGGHVHQGRDTLMQRAKAQFDAKPRKSRPLISWDDLEGLILASFDLLKRT